MTNGAMTDELIKKEQGNLRVIRILPGGSLQN